MAERLTAERQCVECGATYAAVYYAGTQPRVTCGLKECARLHERHRENNKRKQRGLRRPARILVCPTCHETFKPRASAQMYCTPEHRFSDYRRPGMARLRTCNECGESFAVSAGNRRDCSVECRARAKKTYSMVRNKAAWACRPPLEREIMVCAECGQEVPRLAPNQKVCGKGCRRRREARVALEKKRRDRLGIGHRRYLSIVAERKLGQGGGCAICGRVESSDLPFGLDHDHDTGQLRGWLCNPCNAALGFLQDDPALLDAAKAYLARWKSSQTKQLHLA